MKKINSRIAVCPFCLAEHEMKVIVEQETSVFKGVEVSFDAHYLYCESSDEMFEDEILMKENDLRFKDAYREKMGLLRSSDIRAIRDKYGVSQSDLSIILQWGGKTVTRYETHQVQAKAHDVVLRKLGEDPGWYLELLENSRGSLTSAAYKKYYDKALSLYEKSEDYYVRRCIESNCKRYISNPVYCGGSDLSFSKIVDVIKYYSSSPDMKSLYKVKLMKLMWYADFLSYKLWGRSITGLPYLALPMGAVPESHDYLIMLKGVSYEINVIKGNEAYHFVSKDSDCPSLSDEDKQVLDKIIEVMGDYDADKIISCMHKERAYKETKPNEVISYEYAKYLSIG